MLTKAITVSTKGEKATFSIKLSGKGHNSLDFFCDTCHSQKPIASILDSENYFLFFKRTEDGFDLKKKEYPPEEKWTYDGGRYIIEPGAYDDQTEVRMPNGKIFIFRNDYYQDIRSDGITVGFFDGKSTRLFIRCYVKDGMMMIEFA
ncbi:MAG: hypothetical protein IKW12_03310 [Clostridia bacterium]|nr:hypothetical protein [Clostridia bacterium]